MPSRDTSAQSLIPERYCGGLRRGRGHPSALAALLLGQLGSDDSAQATRRLGATVEVPVKRSHSTVAVLPFFAVIVTPSPTRRRNARSNTAPLGNCVRSSGRLPRTSCTPSRASSELTATASPRNRTVSAPFGGGGLPTPPTQGSA